MISLRDHRALCAFSLLALGCSTTPHRGISTSVAARDGDAGAQSAPPALPLKLRIREAGYYSTDRVVEPNRHSDLPANAILVLPVSELEAMRVSALRRVVDRLGAVDAATLADPARAAAVLAAARTDVDDVATEIVVEVVAELHPLSGPKQSLSVGRTYDDFALGAFRPTSPVNRRDSFLKREQLDAASAEVAKSAATIADKAKVLADAKHAVLRSSLQAAKPGKAAPASADALRALVGDLRRSPAPMPGNMFTVAQQVAELFIAVTDAEAAAAAATVSEEAAALATAAAKRVPLTGAPDAVVDLSHSGHAIGDQVVLEASFYRRTPKVGTPGAFDDVLLRSDRYQGIVKRSGAYLNISPSVVFARAATGSQEAGEQDAKDWRPTIAVGAEWRFGFINPGEGTQFWSWLDPGFGVHLAAPDQSSAESTEFGLGVNLSLWNGLVQGGYGWNLSVDREREYFFVGVDLLTLFGAKTGIKFPGDPK